MPEDREEGRKLGCRLENTAKGILWKIYYCSTGFEKPTEEVSPIDIYPVSDCWGVCGFSEESEKIGIDVVGLPVSSDEILWIGCALSVSNGIISYV